MNSVSSEDEVGGYIPPERPSCSSINVVKKQTSQPILYSGDKVHQENSSHNSYDAKNVENARKRKLPMKPDATSEVIQKKKFTMRSTDDKDVTANDAEDEITLDTAKKLNYPKTEQFDLDNAVESWFSSVNSVRQSFRKTCRVKVFEQFLSKLLCESSPPGNRMAARIVTELLRHPQLLDNQLEINAAILSCWVIYSFELIMEKLDSYEQFMKLETQFKGHRLRIYIDLQLGEILIVDMTSNLSSHVPTVQIDVNHDPVTNVWTINDENRVVIGDQVKRFYDIFYPLIFRPIQLAPGENVPVVQE